MLPGSQSSKLKKATVETSGDPRFRLFSSVPRGGVLFGVLTAAFAVMAGAGIVVMDRVIDGRVDHAIACAEVVAAMYRAEDFTEPALMESIRCVERVGGVDDELNTSVRHIRDGLSRTLTAIRFDEYHITLGGRGDVIAGLGGLVSWLEMHRDPYRQAARVRRAERCGRLAAEVRAGSSEDIYRASAALECYLGVGSVGGTYGSAVSQVRSALRELRDAARAAALVEGGAIDPALVQEALADISSGLERAAAWIADHREVMTTAEAELARLRVLGVEAPL